MAEGFCVLIAAYLFLGIAVTIHTKDPEQDGWVWMILLWPLQLAAFSRR